MAKDKDKQQMLNIPQNKDVKDSSSLTIHLGYIIGILSAIILFLLGYIFTYNVIDSKVLAPFASWTSTILSIVLSILAIIYSYYSIRDTGLQMSQMKETLGAITATNQATNNIVHTLLKTVVSLHDKVSAIEEKQRQNNNNIPYIDNINYHNTMSDNPSNTILPHNKTIQTVGPTVDD